VRLEEPIAGVAPGQSAVFYKEDLVVGGGVVRRNT
jgi:tRNA U34 2-thiouridine synthase MnmA/TrmU